MRSTHRPQVRLRRTPAGPATRTRPMDVTAEAAAGLAELADLVADEEATLRLRRAIEALAPKEGS